MKSMLHEASSVTKAIQKAWEEAGRPEEFTIRILEREKTKMFGLMVQSPAVVSIAYEPSRKPESTYQSRSSAAPSSAKKPVRTTTRRDGKEPHAQSSEKVSSPASREAHKSKETVKVRPTTSRQKEVTKELGGTISAPKEMGGRENAVREVRVKDVPSKSKEMGPRVESAHHSQDYQADAPEAWSDEHKSFIEQALKELNSCLSLTGGFSLVVEKKALHVIYDNALCESSDDERLMYISISYLLMQFLKKQFKKKFRGYQILVARKS